MKLKFDKRDINVKSAKDVLHLKLCFFFSLEHENNVCRCHGDVVVPRLPGHTGSVNEVCFHPKEPIIASVASDRTGELRQIQLADELIFAKTKRYCLIEGHHLMYLNSAKKQILNSSYEIMDQHNYGPNDLAQQDGLHGRAGRLSCADPCSISMLKDVQKDLWLFLFSLQLNCKKVKRKKVKRTSMFK